MGVVRADRRVDAALAAAVVARAFCVRDVVWKYANGANREINQRRTPHLYLMCFFMGTSFACFLVSGLRCAVYVYGR